MTKENRAKQEYTISSDIRETFDDLFSNKTIKECLEFIEKDHNRTLKEQKEICAISAPTFKEANRADDYMKRFLDLGLEDVKQDTIGNVLGHIRGSKGGLKLVVAAHLDTVFPEGTETKVVEREGRFFAPGIADDTRGLAEILCIVRAIKKSGIQPLGDIVFCGNVGEEGLGDLRGTKKLFSDYNDIDGFITIDGTGVGRITYLATGSHRFKVTYKGPGGHSFGQFGLPSAIHAAGRAIAKMSDLQPPEEPKTTFTVGMIHGGTSVNSIAESAEMLIDIRSNNQQELLELEDDILDIIKKSVNEENDRWNSDQMSVNIELLGDRPAGTQSPYEPIVQATYVAGNLLGIASNLGPSSSTDANVPINRNIPAIAVGRGGESGEIHTTNEWFDPENAFLGPQKTFLAILSLAGVTGISSPLLKKA